MPPKRDVKNTRSGSTTWVYEPERMRGNPAGQAARVPKAPRWGRLRRRDSKDRLTITVKFRGGAECWYHIEARGSHGAFPGVMALHDVMREINEGNRRHVDGT